MIYNLSSKCRFGAVVLVDGFQPTGTPTRTSQPKRHVEFLSSDAALDRKRHTVPLYFSAVNIDAGRTSSGTSSKQDQQFLEHQQGKNGIELNSYSKRPARSTIGANGDLPWSNTQEWALRDNLSKYSIRLVGLGDGTMQRLVRWRTLVNSTPELAGYPIEYVISRYEAFHKVDPQDDDNSASLLWGLSTQLLPYIDRFHFESNGGVSGQVFGVRGIQDGTRICTNPVVNVENSIPLGYVVTEDGSVVYELGQPETSTMNRVVVANDDTVQNTSIRNDSLTTTKGELSKIFDPDLIQLAGLTAVVLTGAWAMQALSHHLTVNIFWV